MSILTLLPESPLLVCYTTLVLAVCKHDIGTIQFFVCLCIIGGMGDKRRGKVLLNYIARNFRGISSVISVADGNLVLAREIYLTYKSVVYDPRIRNRNIAVRSHIKVVGKPFYSDCSLKCDLVIGLHPDEATGEIVDYSIRTRTPCLIVPCCMVGQYSSECRNKGRWVKFLANILIQNGFDVFIDQLPISGSNLAIRAYPLHQT